MHLQTEKHFWLSLHQLSIVWEHLFFCCLILYLTFAFYSSLAFPFRKYVSWCQGLLLFSSLNLPQCLRQRSPYKYFWCIGWFIYYPSWYWEKNRWNIWSDNCTTFWDVISSIQKNLFIYNIKFPVIVLKSNKQATVC